MPNSDPKKKDVFKKELIAPGCDAILKTAELLEYAERGDVTVDDNYRLVLRQMIVGFCKSIMGAVAVEVEE